MRSVLIKAWYGMAVLLLLSAGAIFANDFYTHGSFPSPSSPATSASMRAELDLISSGFAKLPTLSGNGGKAVIINSGATALSTTTGQLSLAGNFSITGAFDTTLVQISSTTLTLPAVSGTLATLNGIETFTGKSISGSQITSAVNNAISATIANTVVTNANLSGPITSVGNSTAVGVQTGTGSTFVMQSGPTISSMVSSTVSADPTVSLGIASKQYVDSSPLFTTGDVKLTLKTTADSGFVLMNDGSIGDSTSGATTRANADTSALYTLIWTNIVDQWAPVAGGRGGSAAADFSAHKALMLPKTLGRALAGYGVGTTVASGVNADVDTTAETLTVASNNTTWITGMPVVFTLTSGTITGLVTSTTYYVIRATATTIKLATTLALAQAGTPIDLTAKSSPIWTITYTFTSRAIGEQAGEDAHAQSLTELLAHTHGMQLSATDGGVENNVTRVSGAGATATSSTGGNAAMNIMQGTTFLNVMVKL